MWIVVMLFKVFHHFIYGRKFIFAILWYEFRIKEILQCYFQKLIWDNIFSSSRNMAGKFYIIEWYLYTFIFFRNDISLIFTTNKSLGLGIFERCTLIIFLEKFLWRMVLTLLFINLFSHNYVAYIKANFFCII